MKAYLEREAALNKLRQIRDYYRSRYNGSEAAAIAEYCRDALIDIPTADVAEVVRCAECAHHVDCGYHYCNMWCVNCPDDADFFCAYGERDGGVNA